MNYQTTKKFSQVIADGYAYPSIIPDDLQAVIYDWYQDRHVADDDKFELWFTRLLNRDYGQYQQLLRIEPGVAQYDWLVTRYHELQRQENGSSTGTTSITKNGTDQLTHNTTITDEGGNTRTYNESTQDTRHTETTDDGTTSYERDDTTDTSESGTTGNTGKTTLKGDDKAMVRSLPMQTSYEEPASFNLSDVILDWSTATTQEGQGHEQETNTQDNGTTSSTGKTTLDSDAKETVSDKKVTQDEDTKAHTGTVVDDKDATRKTTGTDTTTSSGTETGANSGSSEDLTREIMTGREGQIATILENAKQYIVTTNAWQWFVTKLDTCFMGVYDV